MRKKAVEANVAFNHLIWQRYFIIIGMSFSCKMDRSFLSTIGRFQDDLPIGESSWLIMNRNQQSLDSVTSRIGAVLPRSEICVLKVDFASWVNGPMKELQALGVLSGED
jgi:hypothetical protein